MVESERLGESKRFDEGFGDREGNRLDELQRFGERSGKLRV